MLTHGRGRAGDDCGRGRDGSAVGGSTEQEAEAQMKDSPIGEGELCGLEVQAHRLGKHVEDMQTQMLVRAKGSRG
jgi:hypothetical protein